MAEGPNWVRAKRTKLKKRINAWYLKALGLSNNAISDKLGITRNTVSKLISEFEGQPHVPCEYLVTVKASDLLKARWKELWGIPPAQTTVSPDPLALDPLASDHDRRVEERAKPQTAQSAEVIAAIEGLKKVFPIDGLEKNALELFIALAPEFATGDK